jgi:hypothetical protein
MKQVQQALVDIGIPVFVGAWRATPGQPTPPAQYLVYSPVTTEDSHHDDHVIAY